MPPNDIQNLLVFAYLSADFLWLLYAQTSAEFLTLEGVTLSPVPPSPPFSPSPPHAPQCNKRRTGLALLSWGFSTETLFHPLSLCWNWWLLKPKLECVNLLRKWVLEPNRKLWGLSTFASTDSYRLLESPSLLGSYHSSLSALLLLWLISDLSFSD